MIEQQVRNKLQPIFTQLGRLLIYLRISPQQVTTAGLITGLLCGIAIGYHWQITALLLLWISGLCDVLDGTMARLTEPSRKGAYFDLISDRLVESSLMLGLAIAYPQQSLAPLFFMCALLFHFATFLVAGALYKNNGPKSMHYDKSIIERSEAFIIFSLVILAPQYVGPLLYTLSAIILLCGSRRFFRVMTSEESA